MRDLAGAQLGREVRRAALQDRLDELHRVVVEIGDVNHRMASFEGHDSGLGSPVARPTAVAAAPSAAVTLCTAQGAANP
ncbi:hypothetical protein GCM10010170_031520 [Dactylosporangium salmoneum]|uniref:Uncharacterized protein n=1 Tax=Dactylosporangium salmoneum TaxID=53361 RepID=A0ABP5T4J2_9ACTN